MTPIASHLDRAFRSAIHAAFGFEADPLITPSANDKFGDYQSNAAMGLAKELAKTGQKTNPRAVAEQIKSKLDLGDMAAEPPSIAGPGFINVKLSAAWLARQLEAIAGDERLGMEKVSSPQNVVIDYSGPNIAKEMHVGHIRSTIIGDACARIVEFQGQNTIRQNHIGDWGTQFGMLIEYGVRKGLFSAGHMARAVPYGSASVPVSNDTPILGHRKQVADLELFYREAKEEFDASEDFQKAARQRVVALQSGERVEKALWGVIVEETRRHYLPIYARMNVKLTVADERGESSYNPFLADVVAELKAKGIATESEGATVCFVDGSDNPLIIEKTGGGFLYGTTDLAAVRYRTQTLHAQRVLYFVDARESQHFAQVFTIARRAGWADAVSLEHAAFGTMLGADGKPFKTRSGDTVKLKDLLDEAEERALKLVTDKNPDFPEDQRKAIAHSVGIGGIKYSDLSKDRTSDYMFSWDKMLAMDGNTAPYLQYVYARIRSIFRKAGEEHGRAAHATTDNLGHGQDARATNAPADNSWHGRPAHAPISLDTPHELSLAKHLLRFGEIIDLVGRELKPHHLCTYLYDLATRFSGFYENCPVLQSEGPTRASRLALSDLVARTMALGLDLLGIEHPEQM